MKAEAIREMVQAECSFADHPHPRGSSQCYVCAKLLRMFLAGLEAASMATKSSLIEPLIAEARKAAGK